MKFKTNTLLPELSKASIKRLTIIVDETSDVVTGKQNKQLSAGQLWMIHKQKRNFSTRRFI